MKTLSQKIFDKVSKHLVKQNKKATKDGSCVYRGDNNLRCAIGALIKDEFYKPSFDSSEKTTAIDDRIDIQRAVAKSLGVERKDLDKGLLSALQSAHDDFRKYKGKAVHVRLSEIATERSLNTKALDKLYA